MYYLTSDDGAGFELHELHAPPTHLLSPATPLQRALTLAAAFGRCEGIAAAVPTAAWGGSAPEVQVRVPPIAVAAARAQGLDAAAFYSLSLLEATGISATPIGAQSPPPPPGYSS